MMNKAKIALLAVALVCASNVEASAADAGAKAAAAATAGGVAPAVVPSWFKTKSATVVASATELGEAARDNRVAAAVIILGAAYAGDKLHIAANTKRLWNATAGTAYNWLASKLCSKPEVEVPCEPKSNKLSSN
jgi:hypothetical protein